MTQKVNGHSDPRALQGPPATTGGGHIWLDLRFEHGDEKSGKLLLVTIKL